MKILFTPSDNNMAGAFQSMARLCKILQDDYNCDILVLLRTDGIGQKLLDDLGIPYTKIRSYNWIIPEHPSSLFRKVEWLVRKTTQPLAMIYNKLAVKKISRLIKDENIDIVHLNTTYIYASALAAIAQNVPLVWHLREFLEEDQNKRIWNREKGYFLISKADAVVTISDSLYEKYRKLLKTSNLIKIYNGLDENYYADRSHEILKDNTVHVLIVGTINSSKGQIQAIEAIRILNRNGIKNIELTIVGEINRYAASLQTQVKKWKLENVVHFAGHQRDTAKFYKNSDIVLVCSRFEAFGRVTVEAMMAGCLVIGSNTGGTVELIQEGKTGYLYNYGDTNELSEKIRMIAESKEESRAVANAGREYMLKNMTAKRNAEDVFALYKNVLKKRGINNETI